MGHKPQKRRRGRASEQCITRRGLRIYQKGGQIKTLTGHRWDVASQSEEGVWHRISFAGDSPTCECAHHTAGKGCRCKHIAAVEHTLLISSEATFGKKVGVEEKELCCPGCKQERLNGELAGHFKHARGINKEHSLIFRMAILHHNYIKPHAGIGGRTPAEAAGIDVRRPD